MRPPLHVIEAPTAGRLATMPHPRGARLAEDMAAMADLGVAVLVSALTEGEHERLALAGLAEAAREAGLEYVRFPIVDRGVPDRDADVVTLADRLADDLRAGRSVVIHCWAAIGRSSLLAAATLVRLGVAPQEAWRRISAARGLAVPDTPRQHAWLDDFATNAADATR